MAEVEFRDGKREVADYLASMMVGMETHTMTFTEAIRVANQRNFGFYLERERLNILREHFRNNR